MFIELFQKFDKASNDLGKKQKTATPQLKLATLSAIPTCRQVEDIEQMYIPSPDDQGLYTHSSDMLNFFFSYCNKLFLVQKM